MVSSDFGKDDANRHVTLGLDWAIAGAASVAAAAAAPTPVTPALRINERRSMQFLPFGPTNRRSGNPRAPHRFAETIHGQGVESSTAAGFGVKAMRPCNYSLNRRFRGPCDTLRLGW